MVFSSPAVPPLGYSMDLQYKLKACICRPIGYNTNPSATWTDCSNLCRWEQGWEWS